MPALIFEYEKTLTQQYEKACVCHQPNNQILLVGIEDELQRNETTAPPFGSYDPLLWSYMPAIMTGQRVLNLSVISYPQIGGIGFYTLKHENRSVILAPLIADEARYTAPTMTITIGTDITFDIIDPDSVSFDCYRIVIREGYFADEYVTYDKQLVIPYEDLTGKEIYLIGYLDERVASEPRLYTI